MRQQVNLYQPIFHEHREFLSATTASSVLGVIAMTLLLLWAFGLTRVSGLQRQVTFLQSQQQLQTQLIANTNTTRAPRTSAQTLQEQAKQLAAQLLQRRQALDLLHAVSLGSSAGFAPRLEALARRHVDGVWLDHIVLADAAGVASLAGRALDPALIPRYLQSLGTEPALTGTRFDDFKIEPSAELSTMGADPQPGASAKSSAVSRFHAESAASSALRAKASS